MRRAAGVISSAAIAARVTVLAAVADLVLAARQAVFDTGRASAVRDEVNLHRHWRNARTVLAHNPVDYKRKVVGDRVVNGTEPPRNSYF